MKQRKHDQERTQNKEQPDVNKKSRVNTPPQEKQNKEESSRRRQITDIDEDDQRKPTDPWTK